MEEKNTSLEEREKALEAEGKALAQKDESLGFFTRSSRNGFGHAVPIYRGNQNITATTGMALVEGKDRKGNVRHYLYQPSRYPVTVQHIFRKYGLKYAADEQFFDTDNDITPPYIRRAVRNIIRCRTPAMGSHPVACCECGTVVDIPNSCGRYYCNTCSGTDIAEWTRKRMDDMINTQYNHCVFTVPECLNSFFMRKPREMYNALFGAVSEVLMKFAKDPTYLGATPGFICVLHTWGQTLTLHIHIHVIITRGGLSEDRTQWITPKNKTSSFLFPVRAMSECFRGAFLERFFNIFPDRNETDAVWRECKRTKWVVYCKPPVGNDPEVVLKYLARYTHRVAINNSRLISDDNGKVTFRYHDYRDGKDKTMTLDAEEFMRRYFLHIFPEKVVRIRHYGLLSPRCKGTLLPIARKLTGTPAPKPQEKPSTTMEIVEAFSKQKSRACPFCGKGYLVPLWVVEAPDFVIPDDFTFAAISSSHQADINSSSVSLEAISSTPQGPPSKRLTA